MYLQYSKARCFSFCNLKIGNRKSYYSLDIKENVDRRTHRLKRHSNIFCCCIRTPRTVSDKDSTE